MFLLLSNIFHNETRTRTIQKQTENMTNSAEEFDKQRV